MITSSHADSMFEYIWRVNNLDVFYTNETNGGGDYLSIEFINTIESWYSKQNTILEWCSGPGFIGFGCYAFQLCNRLLLVDKNESAIQQAQKTVEKNNLQENVLCYCDDNTKKIESNIDLIIGNPPHWKNIKEAESALNIPVENNHRVLEICVDKNWDIHKNFFHDIQYKLNIDGKILLQENSKGSTVQTFQTLLEDTDLYVSASAESVMYKELGIYYIEIKKNDYMGNKRKQS